MNRRLMGMLLAAGVLAAAVVDALPASAVSVQGQAAARSVGDQDTRMGIFRKLTEPQGVGPGNVGQPLHFYVSIGDDSASCGIPVVGSCDSPSGTVDLSLTGDAGDTVPYGSGALAAYNDWTSSFEVDSAPPVPAGDYTLTAHYHGDVSFAPNEVSVPVTINPGTVYLDPRQSSTSSALGAPVTFTVHIGQWDDAGQPKPTGTVQFTIGGKPLDAPVPVVPGGYTEVQAVLTTTTLPLGTSLVAADYSGDHNYQAASVLAALKHSTRIQLDCLPHCSGGGTIGTIGTVIAPTTGTAPPGSTSPVTTDPSPPPAASTTATTPATTSTAAGPATTTIPPTRAAPPGSTDSPASTATSATSGDAAASSPSSGSAGAGTLANLAHGSDGAITAGSSAVSSSGADAAAANRTARSTAGSADAALAAGGQVRPAAGQADTGFLQSHAVLLLVLVLILLLLLAGAIAVVLLQRRRRENDQPG